MVLKLQILINGRLIKANPTATQTLLNKITQRNIYHGNNIIVPSCDLVRDYLMENTTLKEDEIVAAASMIEEERKLILKQHGNVQLVKSLPKTSRTFFRSSSIPWFSNAWMYLSRSERLSDRPIVAPQRSKEGSLQAQHYYEILLCLAFGLTPVCLGMKTERRSKGDEGFNDSLVIQGKKNSLLLCNSSSTRCWEHYLKLTYIHEQLVIDQPVPKLLPLEIKDKHKIRFSLLQQIIRVDDSDKLYLVGGVLTEDDEAVLFDQVGRNHIVEIPFDEAGLFGLDGRLYDSRTGLLNKIAVMPNTNPTMENELSAKGYTICKNENPFPWGKHHLIFNPLSFGSHESHTLDSFLDEQKYIERRLGDGFAFVKKDERDELRRVFDPDHIDLVLGSSGLYSIAASRGRRQGVC